MHCGMRLFKTLYCLLPYSQTLYPSSELSEATAYGSKPRPRGGGVGSPIKALALCHVAINS